MKCVIYCRVSSDDQVKGTSLASQEDVCRQYAAREGWTVERVYRDEGESAKTADRPQFQRMIKEVCTKAAGIDRIMVWKLDRFSRNSDDHTIFKLALARCAVQVTSATETIEDNPAGRLLRTMLAGISQFDNDCRAERTITAMRSLAMTGHWVHRAPFGYQVARKDGKPVLEADPVAGPLVAYCFEQVAAGHMTPARVQDYLERAGFSLYLQHVHALLRQPVYAGFIQSSLTNHKRIPAAFSGLITERVFLCAQAALDGCGRAVLSTRMGTEDFPLAGVVACGCCGVPMRGYWARGRGKLYGYYDCRAGCKEVRAKRDDFHHEFEQLLEELARTTPGDIRLLREIVVRKWRARQGQSQAIKAAAVDRLEQARAKAVRLLDKLLDGTITDAMYRTRNAELDAEIALATSLQRDAEVDQVDVEATLVTAERLAGDLAGIWRAASADGKRRFETALFPAGIQYRSADGFRTAAKASVFSTLQPSHFEFSALAPQTGSISNPWKQFRHFMAVAEDLRAA